MLLYFKKMGSKMFTRTGKLLSLWTVLNVTFTFILWPPGLTPLHVLQYCFTEETLGQPFYPQVSSGTGMKKCHSGLVIFISAKVRTSQTSLFCCRNQCRVILAYTLNLELDKKTDQQSQLMVTGISKELRNSTKWKCSIPIEYRLNYFVVLSPSTRITGNKV